MPATRERRRVRPLLLLVVAILFVDATLYAAITPLLPHYAAALDLSRLKTGLLAAGYPVGMVVAALPAGWLATRLGKRRSMVLGGSLLVVSSCVFAFSGGFEVLSSARLLQGASSSLSFAAGFAWLTEATPPGERGSVIGTALAGTVTGVLAGPAVGAIASAFGPTPVFAAVAAVSIALVLWAVRIDAPESSAEGEFTLRGLLAGASDGGLAIGFALTALAALIAGTVQVLAPLQMGGLGASGSVIGLVFLVGAGGEAFASWALGGYSDRRGPLIGATAGLGVLALSALALAFATGLAPVAAAVVAAVFGLGFIWTPSSLIISNRAEGAELEMSVGFAFFNLAWALGQASGGIGGTSLADLVGDRPTYLVATGLVAIPLAALIVWRRRLEPVVAIHS